MPIIMDYKNLSLYIQDVADIFLGQLIFNAGSNIITFAKSNNDLQKIDFYYEIQSIRNYCLEMIFQPFRNHDNILRSFVIAFKELHLAYEAHIHFNYIENLLSTLAETVSYLDITIFDVRNIPARIRKYFYPHLHNMTQLKILYLDLSSVVIGSVTDKSIINILSRLSHLEELTLHTFATDAIIKIIQQSCPKLIFLDVTHSKQVTNESINFLVGCTELKEVSLNHTSVDVFGYFELLHKCSSLINIGRFVKMNKLLEMLNERKHEFNLNIEFFEGIHLETKHLQLLSQICPKLQYIDVRLKNADISVLKTMSSLKTIIVKCASFYNIVTLLEKLGPNILCLHLESVQAVELINISYLCPNVKKLVLKLCTFSDKTIYDNDLQNHFYSVEILICDKTVPLMHLKFLLTNCPNVKVLSFSDEDTFTDNHLEDVLKINQMLELKELYLNGHSQLTVKGFERWFDSCKKLIKVIGLDQCDRISGRDLLRLRILFPILASCFDIRNM